MISTTIQQPVERLAVGTLIEYPDRLRAPRPPLMKRMCVGWSDARGQAHECGLVLGWVVCIEQLAGQISHGVCPECVRAGREDFADWVANGPAKK